MFHDHFDKPVEHLAIPEGLIGLGLCAPRWANSAALPQILPESLQLLQLGHRVFQGAEQSQQVRLGLHRDEKASASSESDRECCLM